MIDEDLNILQEYKDQEKHYDGHAFKDCPNFVKGHVPELYVENQHIKFVTYLVHVKSNMTKKNLMPI